MKLPAHYTIIDLETTGGDPRRDRITEVAIYRYDGEKVIDSFTSLVNPGVPIPEMITRITGIDDDMVRDAPPFYLIAKEIVEITQDTVFVAHNVRFDYSFIQREFRELGYPFTRRQLCTIKLSKKLMPGLRSYSLKNLCKHLKISNEARHRAFGDAQATLTLFRHLLSLKNDLTFDLAQELSSAKLPPNLPRKIVDELPEDTGVYYFYNESGEVIYVGKSTNIRKRVLSHFQGAHKSSRTLRMLAAIHDVKYVLTGSELIALLKENEEIKGFQPHFNRAQRRSTFRFGIFMEPDKRGYLRLQIGKLRAGHQPVSAFSTKRQAESALNARSRKNQLCPKLCGQESGNGRCFHHQLHICLGACVGDESPESYNERVRNTIFQLSYGKGDLEDFFIVGVGRHYGERSVVCVENGIYQGYAYLDATALDQGIESIRESISEMPETPDVQRIIQGYIKRNKKEVIPFSALLGRQMNK